MTSTKATFPTLKTTIRETAGVQTPVVRYARSKGIKARKTSGPGNRSFPDYTFFAPNGIIFLIEFKAPRKEPTTAQLKEHTELRALGHEVWVVDNANLGRLIIDSYL
jgi:hypothetical protein